MRRRLFSSFIFITIIISVICGCGYATNSTTNVQTHTSSETVSIIMQNNTVYSLDNVDELSFYYDKVVKMKEEILTSPTKIIKSDKFIRGETYTGTAYYISPNGNDDNDGLSPETAWQSAFRIMWGDVKEGDAVFFQRGGIYRIPSMLTTIPNVTYSAYGEGSKPILTRVRENSANKDFWELFYEGGNGEKIWHYYKPVGEVSGIIFDDTFYAKRILEWPTAEGWLAVNILEMAPAHGKTNPYDPCCPYTVTSANEYRTVAEQLSENYTYLCRVDVGDCIYPLDFSSNYYEGDLYLRCDDGNPGDCYKDIEVIAIAQDENGEVYDSIFNSPEADGWVLDNLSLKYYGRNAVFSFVTTSKDAVIQNCTIEWGGTRLHIISSERPTSEYCLIGDCLYGLANNVTIRNNYFREGGNSSTFETDGEYEGSTTELGSYLFEGNLVENCGQGIRTYFIDQQYIFNELVIRDNIILNTGDSNNNACFEEPAAIDLGVDPVSFASKLEVYNNILIGSTVAMMRFPYHNAVKIEIHDNVIAQNDSGILITEGYNRNGVISWHEMPNTIG